MMESGDLVSYEKLYYSLWETGQRYRDFCEFRVIGKSHDERMIPMLEVGKGESVLFCAAGLRGTDRLMPCFLTKMASEYCRAYECRWKIDGTYPVRELLDKVRICLIPLVNPDGYEICRLGYSAVRSPVCRQMLQMLDQPYREFSGNARGRDVSWNFPAEGCRGEYLHREPASENETRALMRVFREYPGVALLTFKIGGKGKIAFQKSGRARCVGRDCRMARHLKKVTRYSFVSGKKEKEKDTAWDQGREKFASAEEFYGKVIRRPAFRVEVPRGMGSGGNREERIRTLPLEYLFTIEH